MSAESEFFLGSRSSVVQLDLIEISHTSFSQVYRLVRNAVNGVTVTLETGASAVFSYYPMRFKKAGFADDLDFAIQIEFGDLGAIVPTEIDLVAAADTFLTKPSVVYRTYRSDDLTAPLVGPINLSAEAFSMNSTGCSFRAAAPSLNITKTGENYEIERFPGLRGFL
ncbi:MAG: DUF1833 family protein [Armatimonadota bacterium]|nr:DUF1833 family protein [Armatimonadota bacterium]